MSDTKKQTIWEIGPDQGVHYSWCKNKGAETQPYFPGATVPNASAADRPTVPKNATEMVAHARRMDFKDNHYGDNVLMICDCIGNMAETEARA